MNNTRSYVLAGLRPCVSVYVKESYMTSLLLFLLVHMHSLLRIPNDTHLLTRIYLHVFIYTIIY